MKGAGRLLATALLCASCGGFPYSRASTGYRSDAGLCAWLPDETAQWQLRRSAVAAKVRSVVVPALQTAELDAWLLVEREHQRDPMFDSLGLTESGDKAVLFVDGGMAQPRAFGFGSTPRIVAQLTASGLFEQVQPLTPDAVGDALARFRPHRIGINYSARVALADGISTGTRQFAAWLVGREYAGSFRSAEALVVAFRATRIPDEIELARQAARCAAEIAERALSGAAVEPGRTTSAGLAWQAFANLRSIQLDAPTMPQVSVIKLTDPEHLSWPWLGGNTDTTIATGDVVHLDLVFRYAGVAATVQRTAYVLGRWEGDAPADIRRAADALTQVRASLIPLFRPGVSGRQLLSEVAALAPAQQFALELATHPIGNTVDDLGSVVPVDRYVSPYDVAGVLADRPLQEHDAQSLTFRVSVSLDNGQRLTLSASDDGIVGYGGLDFLVPPPGLLLVKP